MKRWIQTHSGKAFYPLEPRMQDIDIKDISHALSNLCRFTGHCKTAYSVGQHSVLCVWFGSLNYTLTREEKLYLLLHDGSEAYLGDVSSPIKYSEYMKEYLKLEYTLQSMIYTKYGLSEKVPDVVAEIDARMLATEKRDLVTPGPEWSGLAKPFPQIITPWQPKVTRHYFLDLFDKLWHPYVDMGVIHG